MNLRWSAAVLGAGLLASAARARAQEPGGAANPSPDSGKTLQATRKNAAAEELERLALLLGIDAHPGQSDADHPQEQDHSAFVQTAASSWIDAQIRTSDDSISAPPARLADYLVTRQSALSRIVGLLQHEAPDWGFDPRRDPSDVSAFAFVSAVNRVLLAAALVEQRGNRWREANDFLDSSLSLSSSFANLPFPIANLVSIGIEKLQVGTLRKLREPPLGWAERLSGETRWRGFADVFESARLADSSAFAAGWHRAWDAVRERSACDVSRMPPEELWRPLSEELDRAGVPAEGRPIAFPDIVQAVRRAARLVVDRELTSKILAIRAEKAASRDGRWPERFFDLDSRVCPGATYEYAVRNGAMTIRFTGAIQEPDAPALVLPLSFTANPDRPPATPTRTPTPGRPLTVSTATRTLPPS